MSSLDVTGIVSTFRSYLSRYRREDGLIGELDIALFHALQLAQLVEEVHGDLVEIGVYRGGSFALSMSGLRPDESAFAVDVFDIYPRAPHNEPTRFLETMARIGCPPEQYRMVRADTRLPSSRKEILEVIGHGCRWFHIDGGHEAVNVRADLAIAQEAVRDVEGGVIIFDDFLAHSIPEVSEVAISFLLAQSEFAPFAISEAKLYVARKSWCERYARYLAMLNSYNLERNLRHLAGSPVLIFSKRDRAGLPSIDSNLMQQLKRISWSFPNIPEELR